jgi:hypothetical protein
LTRRLSYDWTNDERRVGPRAASRSVKTTGDYVTDDSDGKSIKEYTCSECDMKYRQRDLTQSSTEILEFQEDICKILDDVETDTSTSKGNKNIKKNAPRITSDMSIKGGNILPFLKKGNREEVDPFTLRRSSARSPIKKETEEDDSISEFEATSEYSDSNSYSTLTGHSRKTKEEPNKGLLDM